MKSQWLLVNERELANLKHTLTALDFQGSNVEVPLKKIIYLLNGAENEIRKLDSELEEAQSTLAKIKNKQEAIKKR